jgi:ABC-type transport system involved in multi-copper enzyme maturation permease subunit
MLASELRRIVGRRGSYWSAIFVGFATVVAVIIVRLTQSGDAGGVELLRAAGPMSLPATLMAVLVGALAGSYDTSQGTMRYLVMTGVPRSRLYATRVLGTAIATVICCVPAIVLTIAGAYAFRHDSFNDPTLSADLGAVWAYVANPLVFGLVSLGVGSLLHSNGAAIGVSLGFSLAGAILTGLIANYLSETVADYLLPAATDIAAQLDHHQHIALASAFAAVAAWLVAFLGAGLLRVLRDEY